MPIKAHEIEIDGHTYLLNTLPAGRGLECFTRLLGLIGPAIGGHAQEAAENAGDMAGKLLAAIGKPEAAKLMRELVSGLRKDSRSVDFDLEFAANYGVLLRLVTWSLELNFGSFLGENGALAGLLSRVKAAAPSEVTAA